MSDVHSAQETLDRLLDERRRAWRLGIGTGGMEGAVDEAWANLRAAKAEATNGNTAEIIRRARVEREIEKLMLQDDEEPETTVDVDP